MFPKVMFFAFLAMAAAERPRIGLQMPPIVSSFADLHQTRVVGGTEASAHSFPFIVSLQMTVPLKPPQHFCAGSILNQNWIVTAAHCIEAVSIPLSFLSVVAGKHNLQLTEDSQQRVKVSKMIMHEKYGSGVGPYDIGLLKLASPLKLTKDVQAIELPSPNSEPTGKALLCGWGSISTTTNPIMPTKLQYVLMDLMDRATCSKDMKRLTGSSLVDGTNICTAPSKKQPTSACSGDSGGPLISSNAQKKPVLIGIVSWGVVPCGSEGAPSIYANPSKFKDWMSQKMNSNSRRSRMQY